MEITLPEWICPRKSCSFSNNVKYFKCKNCNYNYFMEIAIKNALWLTLLKFSLDIFTLNVLNPVWYVELISVYATINIVLLVFFGIINVVQLTIKFDTNLDLIKSMVIGLITGVILVLFYIFVVYTYNFIIKNAEYQLDLMTNLIYPLLFCTLGSGVGGFYSWKLFKPVTKDLPEDEIMLEESELI